MKTSIRIFALLLATALSACGGGGGDGVAGSPPPVAGIGRTGIAVGPVSTFGSVVVNGVHFNTDSAIFTVNDAAGTQDDLSVGQVIIVTGTIDDNGTTGTADTVSFDENVKGPVESIDLVGSSLVVLGQTVLVSPDTSFDNRFTPASLEGVSVAQIVEVSGQIDANNNIVATRIEPKLIGTQFEVHGTVSNLDRAFMSFNINNLVVDYSGATLDNFPGGEINDGDFVEAKGTSPGAGLLTATQVELELLLPDANDGDRVEIEGFITRFVSAEDFDVAGLPVTTTANTVFEGGDETDLGLNIKVEAEGDLDANGILVATKVDIRRSKSVRVTANADSVDADNSTLVILGITTTVDALTRFEDKSIVDVDPLTLADISAGDYLEIRGDEFPTGSGTILASIFERDDADTEAILQGFVSTLGNPSFEIMVVTITTNGATVFKDENDNVISAAVFFNQLALNSLVKAKGTEIADTIILATEVSFELEF